MLRVINNQTYKVSKDITELSEGAAVVYATKILSFISFVDNEKRNGIITCGEAQLVITFSELEVVLESTNPNDGTPILT